MHFDRMSFQLMRGLKHHHGIPTLWVLAHIMRELEMTLKGSMIPVIFVFLINTQIAINVSLIQVQFKFILIVEEFRAIFAERMEEDDVAILISVSVI